MVGAWGPAGRRAGRPEGLPQVSTGGGEAYGFLEEAQEGAVLVAGEPLGALAREKRLWGWVLDMPIRTRSTLLGS